MTSRELFEGSKLQYTLNRMVQQVLENHPRMENTCIIGMQPRGVYLARRLRPILEQELGGQPVLYGELDVTFHRDDLHLQRQMMTPGQTQVGFSLEGMNVILVDDVLYTGRTVRAAMDAMLALGRPASAELLVLINRLRKRHLPIAPNYVGLNVETLDSEKVLVRWKDVHGSDSVVIQSDK